MSIEALTWCVSKRCPSPTSKLVLFILANYADRRHSCFPSEKHIAKICGVSDRSVRRCLVALVDCGLIEIKHRKGTSNKYFLSMEASVQRGVDAHDRRVRPRASAYTKDIQKNDNKETNLNELAG